MKILFRIILFNTLIGLLSLVSLNEVRSQSLITDNDHLISGYAKKISGDDYVYHSSVSTSQPSMIVRATDGNYTMVWESAEIPVEIKGDYATFVWLAGLGASPGKANMNLSINDQYAFTFPLDGKENWKYTHPDGSELFFHSDFTDRFGDHFGFMFLRIPKNKVANMNHLVLKVTGGNHRLTSWYMTFKMNVYPHMKIKQLPAIINDKGKNMQQLSCGVVYFGKPVKGRFYMNNMLVGDHPLEFGYNKLYLQVPEVEGVTSNTFRVEAGSFVDEFEAVQGPVKKWHVSFAQHSHTDIGYTRPQADILAEHLRFIDYALDFCDQTDDYPEDAKFKWTCETSWVVNEYLKSRPAEQLNRFEERVKEGRIELAGMYLNFDELPDEQTLAASLAPIQAFRERGLPVKVAMQNDVNGIAWCMNDYYQDLGVKYLNMGTHGHRALICFDKPTLFWWESPSGEKMLAYRAEHYMTGNHLRLVSGNFEQFETYLLNYLSDLQAKEYPYDKISIQFSGYQTDNSPPSTLACDMIKKWNETYEWPKIKTSTITAFFEDMELRYSDKFPVYRGAWPDWWTDGFGASAREVAATREAQADIIANMSGLVMAGISGSKIPENLIDNIHLVNDALLFYTEHTVGYAGSISEPYHKQSMEQRAMKESYAWESYKRSRLIREGALGLLQSYVEHEPDPSVVIYNTLNWKRDGLAKLYIDHQIIPASSSFSLYDESGIEYPAQLGSHESGGSWWIVWIKEIPPFGYKKFKIKAVDDPYVVNTSGSTGMENEWYRIETNVEKGAIVSLYDKDLEKELLDQDSHWEMGQFIYERLGNRRQMEMFYLDDYTRVPLDSGWFDTCVEGPVWNTVKLKGTTEASMAGYDVEIEIRLFKQVKRIDLVYSIVKKPVIEPEGIYIAFPFDLENGKLYFDVQGGTVEAGKDQIPGSANDWNTVQNFVSLRNDEAQVILVSPEVPLVQLGGINTGRYEAGALPQSTHVYSWPMNNYWTTNFNADQRGTHIWTYSLTSGDVNSNIFATRFGWEGRIPFLSRVLPGGGEGNDEWEASFIQGWPDNLLLVAAIPGKEKNTANLHVREIEGESAEWTLSSTENKILTLVETDVLGNEKQEGEISIKPWESKFYKISW